jgi:hypothetical protein
MVGVARGKQRALRVWGCSSMEQRLFWSCSFSSRHWNRDLPGIIIFTAISVEKEIHCENSVLGHWYCADPFWPNLNRSTNGRGLLPKRGIHKLWHPNVGVHSLSPSDNGPRAAFH